MLFYRSSVTKSFTPTLRGKGEAKVSQQLPLGLQFLPFFEISRLDANFEIWDSGIRFQYRHCLTKCHNRIILVCKQKTFAFKIGPATFHEIQLTCSLLAAVFCVGPILPPHKKPLCDWSVSGNGMPASVQQTFVGRKNGTDTKKGLRGG